MAVFNEILVGRYNRALQKLLAMKGSPPAPQLASEIQPSIGLFYGVESRYLEGWDRFGYANTIAAQGAGNLGGNRMRNPVTSNTIMVIEKISMSGDLASSCLVQLQAGLADLATPVGVNNQRFDARGRPTPSAIMTTGIAVSTGATIATTSYPASSGVDFIFTDNQEVPLLPGDTLQLLGGTLNQAFRLTIWWRERFLEDSERT